jgi:hypothetical protein
MLHSNCSFKLVMCLLCYIKCAVLKNCLIMNENVKLVAGSHLK